MRKLVMAAAVNVALAGVAFAQIEASGTLYLLDVDPARYAGPTSQRVMLRVGDQPRNVMIGTQDEICVQLQQVDPATGAITARVRALRPQPQSAAEVKLVGPNIAPGTYRSTPWGLLLRALPEKSEATGAVKAVDTGNSPVCTL